MTAGRAPETGSWGGQWRTVALIAALAAVVVQLVVLYAPHGVGTQPFPHSDKVVHCLVFAAPVALALLAGLPARWVVGIVALHAPVSELVQWQLLPDRSGDPWDVAADLAGVGLGVACAVVLSGRVRRSRGVGLRGSSARR